MRFRNFILFFLILVFIFLGGNPFFSFKKTSAQTQIKIETNLIIKVCGNGTVEGDEFCDEGSNNSDDYSHDRHCNSTCSGWAPYCGDGILQTEYGESCDDGNNNSGDGCDSNCQTEPPPPPSGGGGGAYIGGGWNPPKKTQLVIKGKAYPGADVRILKEGELLEIVKANSYGDFTFKSSQISPGVHTFGVWTTDKEGTRSILLSTTFEVTANAITELSGILLPPTIRVDKTSVPKGGEINFSGQTVPNVNVYVYVHSKEIIKETTSTNTGDWQLALDTKKLEGDTFHYAKALFQTNISGATLKSGYSKTISFYIGQNAPKNICPGADLNNDGKINLMDFSILLYYWGTDNQCADQNRDGEVNLADFSIMMYYWTG